MPMTRNNHNESLLKIIFEHADIVSSNFNVATDYLKSEHVDYKTSLAKSLASIERRLASKPNQMNNALERIRQKAIKYVENLLQSSEFSIEQLIASHQLAHFNSSEFEEEQYYDAVKDILIEHYYNQFLKEENL